MKTLVEMIAEYERAATANSTASKLPLRSRRRAREIHKEYTAAEDALAERLAAQPRRQVFHGGTLYEALPYGGVMAIRNVRTAAEIDAATRTAGETT